MTSHKLIAAGVVTLIYVVLAVGFIRSDRQHSSGGFINLQGMMSGLVTLPVAFLLEYWGHKINFRSNVEMGLAIVVCGALLFGLSSGVMALADFMWNWSPAQS